MILKCVGIAFFVVDMTCTEVSRPPPAAVCPPVRAWSRDFQKQVAAGLRAEPGSALAAVAVQAIEARRRQ
jgi:hypothetical protein